MPLNAQIRELLERYRASGVRPTHELSPEEARANLKRRRAMAAAAPIEMASVADQAVAGPGGDLRLRIYRPVADEVLPIVLYMHGGGWVTGDLDTQDFHCRLFASGAQCVVVSVDYRLAPEHKFPAAADDSFFALKWAAENAPSFGGDPSRIALVGPSAGGNLAAVVAQMARDRGGPRMHFQMLIYPITDHSYDRASYRENERGYLLETADMQWYWRQYLADPRDALDPYASPLRASDLSGLPPAYVITAEYDPLRDEGEEYADRLGAAGVPVTKKRHDGLIHGFFGMTAEVPAADAAVKDAVLALADAFAGRERNEDADPAERARSAGVRGR